MTLEELTSVVHGRPNLGRSGAAELTRADGWPTHGDTGGGEMSLMIKTTPPGPSMDRDHGDA
jgi:hypothetical protein